MEGAVEMANGFAEVGAGRWLMGRGQPAAFFGKAVRLRRKGWCVRDRSRLDLVETTASAKCSDSTRPFLTHIPCAAQISAVSSKVLVAPESARSGAEFVKAVPMSVRGAMCVTVFGLSGEGKAADGESAPEPREGRWVVMATSGRTTRVPLSDGDTLSVRPEAVVAWTGKRPTGFCPRLSIWDVLLPRGPRDLLFTFYGPGVVWIEGACGERPSPRVSRAAAARRAYGV